MGLASIAGNHDPDERPLEVQLSEARDLNSSLLAAIRHHKRMTGSKPSEDDKRLYGALPEEKAKEAKKIADGLAWRAAQNFPKGPHDEPKANPADDLPLTPKGDDPTKKPDKIRGIRI